MYVNVYLRLHKCVHVRVHVCVCVCVCVCVAAVLFFLVVALMRSRGKSESVALGNIDRKIVMNGCRELC